MTASYIPKVRSYLWLPETELNRIATEHYGRPYVAQQTGDMLPNDSFHVYEMAEEDVLQWCYDMDTERAGRGHYLGLQRVAPGTGDRVLGDHVAIYAEGVNWFEYWLAINIASEGERGWYPTRETDDLRARPGVSPTAARRAAPTPHYVLADLIKNNVLPYGTYLMKVSW